MAAAGFAPDLSSQDRLGSKTDRIRVIVTGPTSYATNGFTGLAKASGFTSIAAIIAEPNNVVSAPYGVVYSRLTDKLAVVDGSGVEVSNATDISAYSWRLTVLGS